MSLFGFKEKNKIEVLNKNISVLNERIKQLNSDVNYLKSQLAVSNEEKEQLTNSIEEYENKLSELNSLLKSPHDKQFEKVTLAFDQINLENIEIKANNLELTESKKTLTTDNEILKTKVSNLENQIKILEAKNNSKIEIVPLDLSKEFSINYKLLIKDLYFARKYDDFRRVCSNENIVYVEELNNFDFDNIKDRKMSSIKIKNVKTEFERFKNNEFDLSIREYLNLGHPVSKVFFRYRSFVNYLSEVNINFVSEMDNFNFNNLDKNKFTPLQINKFESTLKKYNELRKINN